METLLHRMPWRGGQANDVVRLVDREWLVTNGLGGYASGTVSGAATRRYHGVLVAALPAPLGRLMMFNQLWEFLRLPDYSTTQFGGIERKEGTLDVQGSDFLVEFRLEAGIPVWAYEVRGYTLEKRLFMPHQQNTVFINYRLTSGTGTVRLKLQPGVHFRPHDNPVTDLPGNPYILTAVGERYEISAAGQLPALRLWMEGERSAFTLRSEKLPDIRYRIEESRGYEHIGALWSPGQFRVDLRAGRDATLVASTEGWETVFALNAAEAFRVDQERRRRLLLAAAPAVTTGMGAQLVLAADQFIITPAGRVEDAARARAAGDEVRTVVAGYHWFTDWSRDTMISLEGLTLTTGRQIEAGYILRTFAHYIRDGLIPNLFPEGKRQGHYHTADATLWYFHAVERYLRATDDRETLRLLLPKFLDIVDHHKRGTHFGIGVDPKDGLLRQGAPGYQLSWMDAKVGDWVVTPRHGKAVEINALWYNALRLLEGWVREEYGGRGADTLAADADRVQNAFNERFWYVDGGYLYDVVDGEQGDDSACRPNQVMAISLDRPWLDPKRWRPGLDVVRTRLLTPVGLRSLAPGHPDYKARYYGDLRSRDAAYHQGTVWAWLIGPFIDAWLRVHPEDRAGARRF